MPRSMKAMLVTFAVIVGALFLWMASPAKAMGMCGLRTDFIKALSDKYQETGRALAMAGQVNLVEIFASKSGTWTILVTTPEGKSCIIAAGTSWEDLPIKPKEKDT